MEDRFHVHLYCIAIGLCTNSIYNNIDAIIFIGHSVRQQTACCRTFEVSALFGPRSGGFRKH